MYSKAIPGKVTLGTEDTWTVLTHVLPQQPIVYSGGVGKNISFELELIKSYRAQVYLFDPSDTGIHTMKALPAIPGICFTPVALSNHNGILQLFLPVNPEEGSYTKQIHQTGYTDTIEFPCRSVVSLMKENGHTRIDILKLDIEGAEYEVLEDIIKNNIEVDQICVEFHHFFDDIPRKTTRKAMKMLRDAGYVRIHRHGLDFLYSHSRLFHGKQVERRSLSRS